MARRGSFIGAAMRVGRAVAAEQRRAQNAAIRQHNAEVRYQNSLMRQAERDFKQAERERLAQEKESAIQYASDMTSDAEAKRDELNSIVKGAIKTPILVDWNSFKQTEIFPKQAPKKPQPRPLPAKLEESRYAPKFGLLDWLFRSRKEKTIQAAKDRLSEAIESYKRIASEFSRDGLGGF